MPQRLWVTEREGRNDTHQIESQTQTKEPTLTIWSHYNHKRLLPVSIIGDLFYFFNNNWFKTNQVLHGIQKDDIIKETTNLVISSTISCSTTAITLWPMKHATSTTVLGATYRGCYQTPKHLHCIHLGKTRERIGCLSSASKVRSCYLATTIWLLDIPRPLQTRFSTMLFLDKYWLKLSSDHQHEFPIE